MAVYSSMHLIVYGRSLCLINMNIAGTKMSLPPPPPTDNRTAYYVLCLIVSPRHCVCVCYVCVCVCVCVRACVRVFAGDADELGCFYGRWMQLAHKAYQGCGTSLGNLHEWIMSRLDDETVAERMVEACE